jgi:hypothetical protein
MSRLLQRIFPLGGLNGFVQPLTSFAYKMVVKIKYFITDVFNVVYNVNRTKSNSKRVYTFSDNYAIQLCYQLDGLKLSDFYLLIFFYLKE